MRIQILYDLRINIFRVTTYIDGSWRVPKFTEWNPSHHSGDMRNDSLASNSPQKFVTIFQNALSLLKHALQGLNIFLRFFIHDCCITFHFDFWIPFWTCGFVLEKESNIFSVRLRPPFSLLLLSFPIRALRLLRPTPRKERVRKTRSAKEIQKPFLVRRWILRMPVLQ